MAVVYLDFRSQRLSFELHRLALSTRVIPSELPLVIDGDSSTVLDSVLQQESRHPSSSARYWAII